MHDSPIDPIRGLAAAGGVPDAIATQLVAVELEDAPRRQLGLGAWLAIGWMVIVIGAALLAPVLPLANPEHSFDKLARHGPTVSHWLGGDDIGRDVLSRLVWGARSSLLVSLGAVTAGFLVGGFLGLLSGFYRNRIVSVIPGLLDIMLAFPQLILSLALVTFLRGNPDANQKGLPTELILIIALGIVAVPIVARITRASVLTWSQREFVLAARAQGAKGRRILVRDVLPNVLPAMFSIALLGIAVAIVAEGGLSILGLGIQLPKPSWGNMISEAKGSFAQGKTANVVFAASGAIFLTVLALNYLGDVIRARFDVRESAL